MIEVKVKVGDSCEWYTWYHWCSSTNHIWLRISMWQITFPKRICINKENCTKWRDLTLQFCYMLFHVLKQYLDVLLQGRILAHLLDACLYIPFFAIQRTPVDGILIDEASRRISDFVIHDSTGLIYREPYPAMPLFAPKRNILLSMANRWDDTFHNALIFKPDG